MDERVTLRSHLDRSTSQMLYGAAVGAVIEAIAGAAIALAALIADGPLAGITGRNGGINSDGDQQKDIDVVADELMRRALRAAPVAAVLSEEAALPEILADARPSYREGRLRLLYEAHPMALVMEWADGSASTGRRRILELGANTPHQRVPLIMGSMRGVREVTTVHERIEPMFDNSDAPLFARRGLFL
jgi:fructose-1,6-bisphosphatase